MRHFGPGGRSQDRGRRPGRAGLVLAAAFLFVASGGMSPREPASGQAPAESRLAGRYRISAHLVVFGSLGDVGSMTIESAETKDGGRIRKTLRLSGSTYPEQAKKKRDYRGEFEDLRIVQPGPEGPVESSSSGSIRYNLKLRSEKMTFFPDHVIAVRENGTETRIEGSYGSILAPLDYLIGHDIKAGDVVDIPFVLTGVPRVFRMEVGKPTALSAYGSQAYEIDLYAIEKTAGPDKAPKDVWRKKGNLKIWFCKDGPYRNLILKMRIKLRWYLRLSFELERPGAD